MMCDSSQKIKEKCEGYVHSLYQCAIAAITVSNQDLVKIVELPTASGKTWIQALIAQHFLSQGKKVTVIEPNETLRIQTY